MADAAFGTGREANPIAAAIGRLRDAVRGTALPVQVHAYDQDAIDRVAVRLAVQHLNEPVAADGQRRGGRRPDRDAGRVGTALDPRVIRSLLGSAVATPDPSDITVEIPIIVREPSVRTDEAQAAAAAARAMLASR